jgi:hypothetical protein
LVLVVRLVHLLKVQTEQILYLETLPLLAAVAVEVKMMLLLDKMAALVVVAQVRLDQPLAVQARQVKAIMEPLVLIMFTIMLVLAEAVLGLLALSYTPYMLLVMVALD